jgi:hypothetical protein
VVIEITDAGWNQGIAELGREIGHDEFDYKHLPE